MTDSKSSKTGVAHTPGPWSCERIWDTPASRIHARVDGGVPIALAEAFTMRAPGEKEANARLIAAAPDLLEALRGVLRVADRATDEFDAARAAIAKAVGHE